MEKRSPWPCFSCAFYEQSNFIFPPTSMMLPGILKKHRLLLFRVLDNHPLPQKTQRDTKKEGTRNCFTFLSRFSESSPQINCKTWSKDRENRPEIHFDTDWDSFPGTSSVRHQDTEWLGTASQLACGSSWCQKWWWWFGLLRPGTTIEIIPAASWKNPLIIRTVLYSQALRNHLPALARPL